MRLMDNILEVLHMSGLLKDKNIVVLGVANERSIVWCITKSLYNAGANVIFTNRQERSQTKQKKLLNKNIVVMGVANERSIAWCITNSLYNAGANLIFTNRQERSQTKLKKLLDKNNIEALALVNCDVESDDSIVEAFAEIKDKVGTIHGLVHSLAFAKTEELQGEYADTSRDGFLLAQNVSAYSLVAVTREARKLMTEGGSIITQTYLGAER